MPLRQMVGMGHSRCMFCNDCGLETEQIPRTARIKDKIPRLFGVVLYNILLVAFLEMSLDRILKEHF